MSSSGSGHGRVEKGEHNAYFCAAGGFDPDALGEPNSVNCCLLSARERQSTNSDNGWGGGRDRCYYTRNGSFRTSSARGGVKHEE